MDRYTGEIFASRTELAERVGIEPRTLSDIMTELASINAVRREKRGRENDGPLLKIMEGEAP